MLFDLTDRVAVVTGGNGGIGLEMARGLGGAGARLVLIGRDTTKGTAAVDALTAGGIEADFIEADLLWEDAAVDAITQAAEIHGRLDILVNNAGAAIRKLPQAYSAKEWHTVMDVNLTAAFLLSQVAHKYMQPGGGGKIINVASILGLLGAPFAPAYCASKGGLIQLTKSLATAWADDGIQVNAILPGWIASDLTDAAKQQVPGLNERVLARTPQKRWGQPQDFAGVAVFLASRASDFVTGTALVVDGGYSANA